ncbi:uncharacterized protein [Lepeophtheirus salmonis]|nr:uncharacterized protein LOC121124339 [Lepeophtheirus salmonis]
MNNKELLSTTALIQILARVHGSQKCIKSLSSIFEDKCIHYNSVEDTASLRDSLLPCEYLNVINNELGIRLSMEELDGILQYLPRKDDTREILLKDFMEMKLISPLSFKTIDRNSDGYLSKGELKLANKDSRMVDIEEVMRDADLNMDKRIDYAEYQIYTSGD